MHYEDKSPWMDSINVQAKKGMGWVFFCNIITLDWMEQLTSARVFTYMERAEHKAL